ncbi:MAG: hypothetical protein H6698_09880 [Myxococcales bacterium]|nr:hypothetical protein [Myxococcales bacterium]MCB9532334.1 hypothetical protein [Myxococcales bacterium]MCB9534592.1 hypothetical protein [Myxococcales bacterium]
MDFYTLRQKAVESAVRFVTDERLRDVRDRAVSAATEAARGARSIARGLATQVAPSSPEDDTRDLKDRLDALRRARTEASEPSSSEPARGDS